MMHNAHLTIHGFIGIGTHNAIIPPSIPPAILPHISASTLLGLTINAKWSKNVIGPFGFQLIGKGNDSGYVIAHICIPPPNVLIPVVIAFGESKVMFSASKVLINVDGKATPTAACCFPVAPLSLNQACNEPCNYPGDIVIAPNSVVVGLTLGDIIGGLVGIALNSIINYLAGKAGDRVADFLLQRVGARIAERIARRYAERFVERLGRDWAEGTVRDIVENLLERPIVTGIKEFVAEGIEELIGNVAGEYVADPISTGTGSVVDSAMAPDPPGATPSSTPVHEAP